MNKKEIEELKRLLFQDRLTQYGKRMLVQYLEQKESILDRVTDKLKELNQKYKNAMSLLNRKSFIAKEYCTTTYDKEKFKLISITKIEWNNWEKWDWKNNI